jgi:serine/threonine-protein kinase
MGVVYRAFDTLLHRTVAVKVIGAQIDSNPEARERFFREARAAGLLSHKNIVTIYDLGEQDGHPFLAMEYLEGEDLQHRLSGPVKMSLSRKLDLAIEICEGLEFAHTHGVVHRDVKPANLFITKTGQLKILDFGLARLMTSQMTNSHMLMGTLNYMSPEQVRGDRADHRSDVFAVGVVMYEIFGGRKAFEGDSFASTLFKILQEAPKPLWQVDPAIPKALSDIVEHALAKPLDERHHSMASLREDLVACREYMRLVTAAGTPAPMRLASSVGHIGSLSAERGVDPSRTPTGMAPPAEAPGSATSAISPGRTWPSARLATAVLLILLAAGWGTWVVLHRAQDGEWRRRCKGHAPRLLPAISRVRPGLRETC